MYRRAHHINSSRIRTIKFKNEGTMKNKLQIMLMLLMMPIVASAQNWTYEGTLTAPDLEIFAGGVHGLAVDGEGKIWVQEWGGSIMVGAANTSPIYVFNPDGTQAEFSPITTLSFEGVDQFLTRASQNRGLATDHNGDVLIAAGANLYRVNHTTGEVMNKSITGLGALVSVGVTETGEIAVGSVLPGNPLKILNEDFSDLVVVNPEVPGFRRAIQISKDGTKFYDPNYVLNKVLIYTSEDGVFGEYELTDTTSLAGLASESAAWDPSTGYIWFSAGSPNDRPNRDTTVVTNYKINTWYAFDPEDNYAVKDSITWNGYNFEASPLQDIRPRAIAFNNDGSKVYLGVFNGAPVQVFSRSSTSIDRGSDVAEGFELKQNYPNPFNPSTTISYTLADAGFATIRVYDMLGRVVATLLSQDMPAGTHSVNFDASQLGSGVYLYELSAGNVRLTNKMTLVK
jgi:hypothetical protein